MRPIAEIACAGEVSFLFPPKETLKPRAVALVARPVGSGRTRLHQVADSQNGSILFLARLRRASQLACWLHDVSSVVGDPAMTRAGARARRAGSKELGHGISPRNPPA